jgi:small subunit ribosomal protein S6
MLGENMQEGPTLLRLEVALCCKDLGVNHKENRSCAAMAFYELTYIIRPDVPTTSVEGMANKISDVLKKHKGKVVKTEQWGLRTLAYPINKHRKGYYTMLGLHMQAADAVQAGIADLEYQLKLSDDVIRFLTIKVDELAKEPSAMLKAKSRADEAAESPIA